MAIQAYSFKEKNSATKTTEHLIAELCKKNGYVVFDVSNIKSYQEKDIDLLMYNKYDKTQFKIEIKSDTYLSPNYFAETISNISKNTLGCWLKTKSDYIFYYFEKNKELHIIPTKKAQEYVLKRYNKLKSVKVATKNDSGKILYYTEGKLVNKKDIQKNVDIKIIYC